MTGIVSAICTRAMPGLPKYERMEGVVVTHFGLDDDYQVMPLVGVPRSLFGTKQNADGHITVLAKETLAAVNERLGLCLIAGDLGENILVQGLGDLSEIPNGTAISIGSRVTLRVVKQHEPDEALRIHDPRILQALSGRSGLRCVVESGVCQKIWPQDEVTIRVIQKFARAAS